MPEELLVELVEQVYEIVASLTEQSPDEIEVTLIEVESGPPGPVGNPGIVVSAAPPSNPSINDLWLQIPT